MKSALTVARWTLFVSLLAYVGMIAVIKLFGGALIFRWPLHFTVATFILAALVSLTIWIATWLRPSN